MGGKKIQVYASCDIKIHLEMASLIHSWILAFRPEKQFYAISWHMFAFIFACDQGDLMTVAN